MSFIYFILGVILGLLIREIKVKTLNEVEEIKHNSENKGHAQFFESVSFKEKFNKSNNISEIL